MRGGALLWVLAAVATLAAAAAPSPAAATERVVFKSDRDGRGDFDLYSMKPDGTDVRRLTVDTGNDYWPRVDARGRRLAFERATPDGSKAQVITRLVDSRELRRLPFGTSGPTLSPDGSEVVYSQAGDLWRARFDGSGPVRLTSGAAVDAMPWWSPDGARIVFQTRGRYHAGDVDLAVVDARGETANRPVHPLVQRPGVDAYPSWSPDGATIAFQAADPGDLATVPATGGPVTTITSGSANDRYPTWTPDSRSLVFLSDRTGNFDVHRISLSALAPVAVSPFAGIDDTPVQVFLDDRDDDGVLDDADPCPETPGGRCGAAATVRPPNRVQLDAEGTTRSSVPGGPSGVWSGNEAYGPGRRGGPDRAFAFDGSSDITYDAAVGRFGMDIANIAFSFRTKTAAEQQSLLSHRPTCGDTADGWWGVRLNVKGLTVEFGGSVYNLLTPPGALADGAWHDVDIRRGGRSIFVRLDGRWTAAGTATASDVQTTAPVVIGGGVCVQNAGNRRFTGLIDDVVISRQTDEDRDGTPDDPDEDGRLGTGDNCPAVANADQADADGDGLGTACDDEEPPPPTTATGGAHQDGGARQRAGTSGSPTAVTPIPTRGAPSRGGAGTPASPRALADPQPSARRQRATRSPPTGTSRATRQPPANAPSPAQTEPTRQRADRTQPAVSAALLRPNEVPLSAQDLVRSLGIGAVLFLLLALPTVVINATVTANQSEITRLMRPLRALGARLTHSAVRRLLHSALASVVAATVLYVFLDPQFPAQENAWANVLGTLLGLSALVASNVLVWRWFLRRYAADFHGSWRVYPGQMAFAALCVAASRVTKFSPGVIIGTPGDYECHAPLDEQRERQRLLAGVLCSGAMSLSAWVVSIPINEAAGAPGADLGIKTIDMALAIIAVAGMETIVFALVPLPFLEGYELARWRPRVWLAIWLAGIAWVSLVLLNPAVTAPDSTVSVPVALALLGTLSVAAGMLWSFFFLRRRHAPA